MSDTKRTARLNLPAWPDGFLVLMEAQDFAFVPVTINSSDIHPAQGKAL